MRALTSEDCPFCRNSSRPSVLESELSFAILDAYPVNPGHLLIIPRRHVASFFDLRSDEREDIMSLIPAARDLLARDYRPDGFNSGVNVGDAAGQTIGHVHVHLIPRYSGDVPDPTGGVRGVVPWKAKY